MRMLVGRVKQATEWLIAPGFLCVALVLSMSPQAASAACSNEAFRAGPSSRLPSCRAYELVTPPEASGQSFQDAQFSIGSDYDLFPIEAASPSGQSLVFSTWGYSLTNLDGANGRLDYDVWQAERAATGWNVIRHVTPGPTEMTTPMSGGISGDHSYVFVHAGPASENKLNSDLGSLYADRGVDYLGDRKGHFELTGVGSLGSEQYAQGRYISPGGAHVIFTTGKGNDESHWCNLVGSLCKAKQLEPNAAPTGTGAVYDRAADGPTKVISLMPGNTPLGAGEGAQYQGTSADGSAVAFKVKGTLYLRVNNEKTEEVTADASAFGGLSSDGRYLFYVSGGDIHRFDSSDESNEEVNSSDDAKMMNVSSDGSHVYFISPSQLDGVKGTVGQPNIYVWGGATLEYVATVLPSDLEGMSRLGSWVESLATATNEPRGPGIEASRLTPNGEFVIFESAAELTPYDNDGHVEIYRYDAKAKSLECISCNPLKSPATEDARLQGLIATGPEIALNNLSEDGSRVFFETDEALVEGDVDGINDAYEWQAPGGVVSSPLGLISSGTSVSYPISPLGSEVAVELEQNVLFGITKDGSNVFFRSQDTLAPGAGVGGTPALYDARIGGGFLEITPPPPCAEEGCHPPATPPPALGGAASSSLKGAGNVVPRKTHHRKSRSCAAKSKRRKHCSKKRKAATRITVSSSTIEGEGGRPFFSDAPVTEGSARVSESARGGSFPIPRVGDKFEDFGIESVAAEISTPAAAMHPDLTTRLVLNRAETPDGAKTKDAVEKLPSGFYGNPNTLPKCTTGEFLAEACPIDSQVGIVRVRDINGIKSIGGVNAPLYNLSPSHPDREVARFGFNIFEHLAAFIDVSVRTAGDYGVTASVHSAPSVYPLVSTEAIIWGNPADPSHDEFRMTPEEAVQCEGTACKAPGGKRESTIPLADRKPFMTNPSACQQSAVVFEVTSYQLPGRVFSASAPMEPPIAECQGLPFEPTFEAEPTNRTAGEPTGLTTVLRLPQNSALDEPGTATMREARVTLPEGMTIAPGAGDGLAACSDQQVHFHEEVDAACPDASKLGSLTIFSPALSEPLEGAVYQRSPEPGHLFRLWLVTDQLGLHVKLPGEIEPDPKTGRLTAVFSDLPQVPVEEIDLDVWGGSRAPLKNPDACGTYSTAFSFAPHSQDPPVSGQAPMTIDQGCGPRGFDPKLGGGVTVPTAGAFSPFVFDLIREDREQDLAGFKVTLPEGELAKLKGVSLCPDASASTGACPAASKIGSVTAAAGPGPNPLWIPQPGKAPTAVYLAGPYKGGPYSIVSVVPAQAGPFDLGNVVVRSALLIDSETAKATVETDPLPQIVAGVPVAYRRLHVVVDRHEFTLNPTDCSQLSITSEISSVQGTVTHPSIPFQVDGCKALKFKPRLSLKLKGGTKRADYPSLRAVLKARPGDANLGRVSVALPHSEFLAQEHIGTICTRPQFAAHKCPKASVYGKAKAWTPLLDQPLSGLVYLRSSSNPLPDLVLDLRGQIEVAVVGRIDSKNGGIRNTFETVPDAPVSKVVVHLAGGKKGLLTNSQDICAGKHRATVKMRAQNGRAVNLRPTLQAQCKKK